MTSKKIVCALLAFCIAAVFSTALCGCDDLGAYESVQEYYDSFGEAVLLGSTAGEKHPCSVADYFYNQSSRDDFLKGEDGMYHGIEHDDYIYVAIPFKNDVKMDSFALYIQSLNDVTVYMNVFIMDTEDIPSQWRTDVNKGPYVEGCEGENGCDDPNPESRVGEFILQLKQEKWSSFVLDYFKFGEEVQNSVQIESDQCILLQIRNNSGIRVFDDEKKVYLDPQSGRELQKAEITMTNLLVRALGVGDADEVQEEET